MHNEPKQTYQISPAPWHLKGEGYLLLYRYNQDFLNKEGCIAEELKLKQKWNIGSVMLVNYLDSPVGPYGELLFIPGMFQVNGKSYWHISKIYVSSLDSVMNGRDNWGIPKELAQFEFSSLSKGLNSVKVAINEQLVFSCNFKDWGPSFPINTSIFPFEFYQPLNGKQYLTHPKGSGNAHFTKPKLLETGLGLFPSIGTQTRLACLHIPDFKLAFPIPNFV